MIGHSKLYSVSVNHLKATRERRMASGSNVGAREAKWGSRMIEVKVRFWTDNLADKGSVIPKHAWTSGVVRIVANETHGIKSSRPLPFNSLLEIGSAIEKVLIEQEVVLYPSRRMQRYFSDAPSDAPKRRKARRRLK